MLIANILFFVRDITFMTYNMLHLANMLKNNKGYPFYGNSAKEWDQGSGWFFSNTDYRYFFWGLTSLPDFSFYWGAHLFMMGHVIKP